MRLLSIVLVVLGSLVSSPSTAADRLSMRVSPAVAFAPANLTIRAEVVADPANRAIEVIAESDEFYRSSEVQLNGAKAPRVTLVEFRSLPGGTYSVRAILKGASGDERAMTQASVNVVESAAVY